MLRTPDQIYDELLVIRAQDGETDALEQLVRRWQPRLRRHAQRLIGNREDAAETTQDAWLAIVRGLRRLNDPARFDPWAYRIVLHKCADRNRALRTDRSRVSLETHAGKTPSTVEDSIRIDEISRLRDVLHRLPAQRRLILALRYVDGFSTAQIAEVLGIPPGTVKSRLHHARGHLRQALERNMT